MVAAALSRQRGAEKRRQEGGIKLLEEFQEKGCAGPIS